MLLQNGKQKKKKKTLVRNSYKYQIMQISDKLNMKILLFGIIAFGIIIDFSNYTPISIPTITSSSSSSSGTISNHVDEGETYPYSSIFMKSINDKRAIECMKYVESTSFKFKNCTIVTNHNSCICYFMKLVTQECETLRDDQDWYLENLNHSECTPI